MLVYFPTTGLIGYVLKKSNNGLFLKVLKDSDSSVNNSIGEKVFYKNDYIEAFAQEVNVEFVIDALKNG